MFLLIVVYTWCRGDDGGGEAADGGRGGDARLQPRHGRDVGRGGAGQLQRRPAPHQRGRQRGVRLNDDWR